MSSTCALLRSGRGLGSGSDSGCGSGLASVVLRGTWAASVAIFCRLVQIGALDITIGETEGCCSGIGWSLTRVGSCLIGEGFTVEREV